MKLHFSTPCAFDENTAAASFGFSGAPAPEGETRRTYAFDLKGTLYTGTYEEILNAIVPGNYQAGIVLPGNAGGEDDFIAALQEKAGCPLTGGAAAIDPATGRSGLITGGGQAAVYLIDDPDYDIRVVSENIHDIILGEYDVETDGKRFLKTVDGQDALQWYNAQRQALGIASEDFEHLTLSDTLGVNAHLSIKDGKLMAGRDLCHRMILRRVEKEQVFPKIDAFFADETALVFGCAGLKGILPQPVMRPGVGMFMFGEVCTVNGVSRFGNLMLSKLCVTKK